MQKQHKQKLQKKKKRNNYSSPQDGIVAQSNALLRLPRRVGLIMPDRLYTRLRFYGLGGYNLVAALTASSRYRPSAAYDVDPLIASTATPGFAECAAFYSNYRVTTSTAVVRFVNPSTTVGIQAILVPLNQDPGAVPGAGVIASWPSNPYCKTKVLGCGGSKAETLSCSMSTEKIFGSKMIYFDDNFASLVTGVPANNWWWAVAVIAPAATTAFVTVEFEINMGVEFFSRKELLA